VVPEPDLLLVSQPVLVEVPGAQVDDPVLESARTAVR
jgi:hypothetical protein